MPADPAADSENPSPDDRMPPREDSARDHTHDAVSSKPSTGTAIFLGTGTSVGVPAIGCQCEVCQSPDPHNKRTRCALALEMPHATILIDTPPDLRTQLLREQIPLVHAVIFTHEHADHLFGLDDLRLFPFRLGHPVPLYCEDKVQQRILKSFDYAFLDREETHPGATPKLEFHTITPDRSFEVMGVSVVPIPMQHGPHFQVLGFRFGDFAYCTDTNFIPDESIERLQGLSTFVVGALRHRSHPTHFSVEQALQVAERVGAQQTYFTHICHDLDHQTTNAELPERVALAYDGLRVKVNLT